MLKVLYLLNFAGKAGTERYVESLVRYLNGKKVEAYFAYNISGLLVERLEEMGVQTFQLSMDSRFDFKAAKKLAQLCKKLGIDVIHTHYLRENYIAMLSKKYNPNVRIVYTSHFVMKNDFITKLSNKLLSKKQDRVIAVCNIGKQELIKNKLDGNKIDVIFNAVDPEFWAEPIHSTLREDFDIADDDFVMLCAARFAHDKGHEYLINSVKLLDGMTKVPFKLVLGGDGELLEKTKAQVKERGLENKVLFIGFQSDMKNLYYGSDIYINSSEHEALSFVIIEAMASGLPIIATDMGGNSDIVNDDSNCGILVEYNNPQSMANAMKLLLEDKKLLERYKKGALDAIERKFNIFKMSEVTYGVYEKAMANDRKAK